MTTIALSPELIAFLRQWAQPHSQLRSDSRQIQAGDIFFAYPGQMADGREFIQPAVQRGAGAVVYEATDAPAECANLAVPSYAVTDLKAQCSAIAAEFYGNNRVLPLLAIGVTGTNGKTSSTFWIAQCLEFLGKSAAVMGTLGQGLIRQIDVTRANRNTTPDALDVQRVLRELAQQGAQAVALEVSSIGLEQARVDAVPFTIALFTNLTRDHLDYHGDMATYAAAKSKLFQFASLRYAVLNLDDPASVQLRPAANPGPVVIGYSLGEIAQPAWCQQMLRARQIEYAATHFGTRFTLSWQNASTQESAVLRVPVLGAFNVSNLLGVGAVLLAAGYSFTQALAALEKVQAVPGRMQLVNAEMSAVPQPLVVVDYAHTPDALQQCLQALRPVAQARGGKLWVVFGCGGKRDPGKRPQMAAVAAAQADQVILTSDNPRSEDPQQILQQMLSGLVPSFTSYQVELERAAAIRLALRSAAASDVILLAGKGAETYQEIADIQYAFSDVQHARVALRAGPCKTNDTAASDQPIGIRGNLWQIAQILQGAQVLAARNVAFNGVSTDSRQVQAGQLFIALRGEKFDGHAFVAEVLARGAVAVLVERTALATLPPLPSASALLVVPNTRQAFGELALAWRQQFALPCIAVTGSNGKTTVKEMLAAILAAEYGAAGRLATQGNLNNEIGVPLTLCRLHAQQRAAVLELGMNQPGEIAALAKIARPTIALVNNAQREHQEFMDSVAAVAAENGSVFAALPSHGVAVFPAAQTEFQALWRAQAAHCQIRTFALFQDRVAADVLGHMSTLSAGQILDCQIDQQRLRIHLQVSGEHNARNALAALTAAYAAGCSLAAIQQGLETFQAVKGRLLRHQLAHGQVLIDDTYNANPDSVRAAIAVLAQWAGAAQTARTLLVLGDMGEVGAQGPVFHAEVGAYAKAQGITMLYTLGPLSWHASQAFGSGAQHFTEQATLIEAVLAQSTQGTQANLQAVILVKGSRFMRMERVVEAVLHNNQNQQNFGSQHAA